MEKILTIVIPTYNMQDYLRRCLDSLIVPKEQMSLLEVLVINDGSKDDSSVIAHEYQDKYPDTFRVIDKENGNYGSCVNRGLKEATGKYIKILDADDWFEKKQLPVYLQFLTTQNADLVLSCCNVKNPEGQVINTYRVPFMPTGCIMGFDEFAKYGFFPQMHIAAYKVSILRYMNYRQTEGISYTDMEWVQKPMSVVKTISFIEIYLYNYLIGREGQTVSDSVTNKMFNQHCKIACSLLDFAKEFVGDSCHKSYLENKARDYMKVLYRKHIIEGIFDDEPFREFDDLIRKKYTYAFTAVSGIRPSKIYISLWRHLKVGKKYSALLRSLMKLK